MESFRPPDWRYEIDVGRHLARIPDSATIKGMFIQDVVNEAAKCCDRPIGRGRYVPFRSYPMREWVEVLVEAARVCEPDRPLPVALRRLGLRSFPTFRESIVGGVLLGMAGDDPMAIFRLYPKALQLAQTGATAAVRELGEREVILELRGMWDFPTSYNVGVVEGAGQVLKQRSAIGVRIHSPCDADLHISWRPVAA